MLAVSTVHLHQVLRLMDEVFNMIHQMQDCLEQDRTEMLMAQIIKEEEEEEECPVGKYSGEIHDFDGNNKF